MVSLYVLLRGEEALSEIGDDYAVNTDNLNKGLDLRLEHVPDREDGASRLKINQLAQKIGPLLVEAGEAGDTDMAVKGYNATYRVQSQYAVHAGLSTMARFIRLGEWSSSVEPNPPAPFYGNSQFAALYTLHLAKYVFKRFEIPTDAVEAAWDDLHQFVQSHGHDPPNGRRWSRFIQRLRSLWSLARRRLGFPCFIL